MQDTSIEGGMNRNRDEWMNGWWINKSTIDWWVGRKVEWWIDGWMHGYINTKNDR